MKKKKLSIIITLLLICGCSNHKDKYDESYGNVSINENNEQYYQEKQTYLQYLKEMQEQMVGYTPAETQGTTKVALLSIENRDSIVVPDFLPVYINQILAYEIESYLLSHGYLGISSVTVIDDTAIRSNGFATFDLTIDGYSDILTAVYDDLSETLSFNIKK